MESISDIVFGELRFNGSWVRDLELTFLGTKSVVEIIVEEGNDDSIADEQRTAYQQLQNAVTNAENEIFKFYQKIRDDYRLQFGDQADVRMPKITTPSELAPLVKLTGVVFPMVLHPNEISIGFLLECSWDPEHGLGVKFTNDDVEVGGQDIIT